MIIETTSKESIETSLSSYLDIEPEELYQYIDYAATKSQKEWSFNTDIFYDELMNILSDYIPDEPITGICLFHLARRLNNSEIESTANLKDLLTQKNEFSDFLLKYGVTFEERADGLVLMYNGREDTLEDTEEHETCYLRSRLGYKSSRVDYCVNGFVLRDQLLRNSYAIELYEGPEFLVQLSKHLRRPEMIADYQEQSTYYCYKYIVPFEKAIFDDAENLDEDEKRYYLIYMLCTRLLLYMDNSRINDNDNPVIRLADDENLAKAYYNSREIITLEMIQEARKIW